eukprot:6185818-Pleurochrysis_carterae.AAC.2
MIVFIFGPGIFPLSAEIRAAATAVYMAMHNHPGAYLDDRTHHKKLACPHVQRQACAADV